MDIEYAGYNEKELKVLKENEFVYFANRCLFCKYFIEETTSNSYYRYGYCKKLLLKINESGICKQFVGI